jgi:hypothetical protein
MALENKKTAKTDSSPMVKTMIVKSLAEIREKCICKGLGLWRILIIIDIDRWVRERISIAETIREDEWKMRRMPPRYSMPNVRQRLRT